MHYRFLSQANGSPTILALILLMTASACIDLTFEHTLDETQSLLEPGPLFFAPPDPLTDADLDAILRPALAAYAAALTDYVRTGEALQGGTHVTNVAQSELNTVVWYITPTGFACSSKGAISVWLATSTGEWVRQQVITVPVETSKGDLVAHRRLIKKCHAAADQMGDDYRGDLGSWRLADSSFFGIGKDEYEGQCAIFKKIPHCIGDTGHPYPDCEYTPLEGPIVMEFRRPMGCELSADFWSCEVEPLGTSERFNVINYFRGLPTHPDNDVLVEVVLAYAQHYIASYDSELVANVASHAAELMNAAERPYDEDGDSHGDGRHLFTCRRHTRDYSQFCDFDGNLATATALPSSIIHAGKSFDLSSVYEHATAYRGLVPHGRLRILWTDTNECWKGEPTQDMWLSTASGQRIMRLLPGTGQDDNVFDASLLREDGAQLWTAQRKQDQFVFEMPMKVGAQGVPQLPFGPATRVPNSCKMTALGLQINFDQTDIQYDLDSIQRETEHLTTIRQQQAQILVLSSEARQASVCAAAHMIEAVTTAESAVDLADLSPASKLQVVSMIELAEKMEALPPIAVPIQVDDSGQPVTDFVTGEPVPNYDAIDLSRYVADNPVLMSTEDACTGAPKDDAAYFVEIDNQIHELLTFAWALAVASNDEQVLRGHQEWVTEVMND